MRVKKKREEEGKFPNMRGVTVYVKMQIPGDFLHCKGWSYYRKVFEQIKNNWPTCVSFILFGYILLQVLHGNFTYERHWVAHRAVVTKEAEWIIEITHGLS